MSNIQVGDQVESTITSPLVYDLGARGEVVKIINDRAVFVRWSTGWHRHQESSAFVKDLRKVEVEGK